MRGTGHRRRLGCGADSASRQCPHQMGGLNQALPWTYTMMVLGSLALVGFPFLTGFYSK
ncbi:MAG: proton-conducting transporter membrane subunit, partial [Pseudomonadota bacterium]